MNVSYGHGFIKPFIRPGKVINFTKIFLFEVNFYIYTIITNDGFHYINSIFPP